MTDSGKHSSLLTKITAVKSFIVQALGPCYIKLLMSKIFLIAKAKRGADPL